MIFNFNGLSVFFAAVKFSDETIHRILEFCENHKVPNPVDSNDLHSSLICSNKMVTNFSPKKKIFAIGESKEFDIFISYPNAKKTITTRCLVLKYQSSYMESRFNHIIENGGIHGHDTYQPHITLSYNIGDDFLLDNLSQASTIGPLVIVDEFVQTQNIYRECETCKEFSNCSKLNFIE
jgi:hypothetical protein